MLSRREMMGAGVAAFGALAFARYGRAEAAGAEESVVRGQRFLSKLLDPDLGLLPEFAGAKTYWLFHDNYLAAKVLEDEDPKTAATIRAAIKSHGVSKSGKIEILFDEAPKPLPFHHYRLVELKRIGDKVLKTEVVTDQELKGWAEYADLLFFATMALAKTDPDLARSHLAAAEKMWDGTGFKDKAAGKGLYATYKLALALLAARKLGATLKAGAAIRAQLLALQSEAGGWITDYNADKKPMGMANVETTSLAVLAISKPKP